MIRRTGFPSRWPYYRLGAPIPPPAGPVIIDLSSVSATRWSGAKTITITGSNFQPGCAVLINSLSTIRGGAVGTTFVSDSSLTLSLPRQALWEAEVLNVTVTNPGLEMSNAVAYTVTQPTSLQAERRADKGITLNGSTVQVWADQSGKGDANRDFTQLTASAQGTFVAGTVGTTGHPKISFGADDFMESGLWSVALSSPATVFAIAKTGVSLADFRVIWDARAPPPAAPNRFQVLALSTTGFARMFANAVTLAGTVSVAGIEHVYCFYFNGATSALYQSAKTAHITGTTGTVTSQTGDRIAMNNASAISNPLLGDASFYLVFSGAIAQALREEVTDYLGWWSGITIGA